MKVAIYARVSTDDKGQDPLNQLLQLRQFASAQPGWNIAKEYVDRASGKNADRRQFQDMLRDAARHRFDVLLFWSLDRLTREGTWMTLCYLRQLSSAGVRYKSLTEQYIDSLGPFSEAIIGIIGAVAQQERVRLSERTRAGLARARAAGRHLGRPRIEVDSAALAKARSLREAGMSLTHVAKRLNISRTMLWKRLGSSGM